MKKILCIWQHLLKSNQATFSFSSLSLEREPLNKKQLIIFSRRAAFFLLLLSAKPNNFEFDKTRKNGVPDPKDLEFQAQESISRSHFAVNLWINLIYICKYDH
jgi:hypothetical protein